MKLNYRLRIIAISLVLILALGSFCLAEEWVCSDCGSTASGGFCSNCGAKHTYSTDDWTCPNCGNDVSGNFCNNCGTSFDVLSEDVDETNIDELIAAAKSHTLVAPLGSPDKYTFYIQDYVGRTLSSVGYTSLGGDRMERYGHAVIQLCLVNIDGSYINIENEEQLAKYIIIGQNIAPNTELKMTYEKRSDGEEYSNLIEWQSIDTIDLLVAPIDGTIDGETVDYESVQIMPATDRYTYYIRSYIGKNLLSFGYTSLGGNRMDEYGHARIQFILITDDGSTIDVEDYDQVASYVVTGQDVPANTELKMTYEKKSDGEEYSNLIDTQSFEKITLQLKHIALPDGFNASGTDEATPEEQNNDEVAATGYAAMTIEELYALRAEIDEEIQVRLKGDDTLIYEGTYIVGKDIEPGAYIISGKDDTIIIHVYESEEAKKNYNTTINDFVPESGYHIGLREGMVIEILTGNGYIVPAPEDYNGTTIVEGTYYVGLDIQAGSYVLSGAEGTIITHVYNSVEDFMNYNTAINDFVPTSGYNLTLEDGMVFQVLTGNGYIINK